MEPEVLDPAEVIEREFLALQKPMNAIIDRGDSTIQQCYRDSVVLITGATGFLGKQLVEKLIRSSDIKTIYMLIRLKKGVNIDERVEKMLQEPVFDTIHAKKPNFVKKLVPIAGNISENNLGMSFEDWMVLTKEVDFIFHLAATTKFDEELNVASIINVRGTREVIALGKACKKLRSFVHVSTAFTHATRSRVGCVVLEQFYPCPIRPDHLIELAEGNNNCGMLDKIPELMSDWPNTYVFTKAVAEELVRMSAGELPVSILRPPIVTCSLYEPTPGWLDKSNVLGPSGVILGIGVGAIHIILAKKEVALCGACVDSVANAMIAVGWDTITRWNDGDRTAKIFTISNYEVAVPWGIAGKYMRKDIMERLSTPKAFWYTYLIETENHFIYWLLTWFLHLIPAYLIDGVMKITGIKLEGVPSAVKIYKKIYKLSNLYAYFLMNNWIIRNNNTVDLISKLAAEDKVIYDFDIVKRDYIKTLDVLCIGLRKFILKDNLKGSVYALKRQKVLKVVNAVFIFLYLYVIYRLLILSCYLISSLLNLLH